MNITPINNNQKQETFGLKVVKSNEAAKILRQWFPKKGAYARIELDMLDIRDARGRNIIAHADNIGENAIRLTSRGQSVDVSTDDLGKKSVAKYFRSQVNALTQKINDKILS